MIEGMDGVGARLAPGLVAAIVGALAEALGPASEGYRVTSVRPLGWHGVGPYQDAFWGVAGRQEACLLHQHFGEGRRP